MKESSKTIVAALAALVLTSCGPAVVLEPLIGEEPEMFRGLATTIPDLGNVEPARVVERVYAALVRGETRSILDDLSEATQAALEAVARRRQVTKEALLESNRIPLEATDDTGDVRPAGTATVLRWLLVDDLASVRTTLVPDEAPRLGPDTATLYVVDSAANFRTVLLRLEGGRWRIEQTSFVPDATPKT